MAFVPTQISPSIVIFSHWSLISDHLWTHTKSLSIERGRKKRRLFVLTQNFLFFWSTIFYAYTACIKKQEIFIQNKDFFRDKTSLLKLINLKNSLKSIKVSYCTCIIKFTDKVRRAQCTYQYRFAFTWRLALFVSLFLLFTGNDKWVLTRNLSEDSLIQGDPGLTASLPHCLTARCRPSSSGAYTTTYSHTVYQ